MSAIEWTDETWNPVVGCTRVSAGCDNCYAATMTRRLEAMGQDKYAGLVGKGHFNGVVRTVPDTLEIPLRWRKPRRVFVNSMSDLFHKDVPDEFILQVFTVMAQPVARKGPMPWPRHTYQVLTKRPERAADFLSRLTWWWGTRDGGPWRMAATGDHMITPRAVLDQPGDPEPAPNIWIGTSVEDQATADERIPHLLRCPAAVRFLSCEPLLGPVDLDDYLWRTTYERVPYGSTTADMPVSDPLDNLHWVIVGGESGPGARPFDIAWARDLIRQCRDAGVPCFVKQLGAKPVSGEHEIRLSDKKGGDPSEWPGGLRVREFPPEAAS